MKCFCLSQIRSLTSLFEQVKVGMPLETLKALLYNKEETKDTKSLYVVDLSSPQLFFPDVLMKHQAEWTGKTFFIFHRPKKTYIDCKIDTFQCHYNKKESLLTFKIRLYFPRYRIDGSERPR